MAIVERMAAEATISAMTVELAATATKIRPEVLDVRFRIMALVGAAAILQNQSGAPFDLAEHLRRVADEFDDHRQRLTDTV